MGSNIVLSGSIGTAAGSSILGNSAVVFATDANHTLSVSESTGQFLAVTSSVSLTATRSLIAPLDQGRTYTVQNLTTGGQPIMIVGATGAGVLVANGATLLVSTDGTNFFTVGAKGPLTPHTTTDWYLDPVGGSDLNTGITLGSPLKTFREITARLGTTKPVFSGTTTFHILSSQTDLSDPLDLSPVSGTCVFLGTPTLASTTTMSVVSYNAGQIVTATITGAVAGQMIVNNTHPGVAFIDTVVGSVCTITVPVASNVPVTTFGPAVVTTWTSGDSISLYTLPQVYAPSIGNDTDNIGSAGISLEHLTIGITGHSYAATGACAMSECAISTEYISSQSIFDTRGGAFLNCYITGALEVGGSYIYAGAIHNPFGLNGASGYVITKTSIEGGMLLSGSGGMYLEDAEVGYLNVQCTGNPYLNLIGNNNFGVVSPNSTIYGTYILNLASGLTGDAIGNVTYQNTAAATFLGSPTFTFGFNGVSGGQSFANALDTLVDPAQLHVHRAITVANLDLPVAAGGFGGTAYSDFGSVITNAVQGTAVPGNLTTTNWYINPSTGSDSNTGLTSGSPLNTWKRLTQLLGPQPWVFLQDTVVTFQADHNTVTDPIFCDVVGHGGSLTIVQNLPSAAATGTISAITPQVIGGPGTRLTMTLPGSPTVGMLVINSTKGSTAMVEAVVGSTATLSQPNVSQNLPTSASIVVDNTWANGDTVSTYNLAKLTLGRLQGSVSDYDSDFNSAVTIWQANLVQEGSFGDVQVIGEVGLFDCWANVSVAFAGIGEQSAFTVNVGFTGFISGGGSGTTSERAPSMTLHGGFIYGGARMSTAVSYSWTSVGPNGAELASGYVNGPIWISNLAGGGVDFHGAVLIDTTLLPGTLNVSASTSVPTTSSCVAYVVVGGSISFTSQPGVVYQVAAVTSSTITLNTAYTGTPNAATTAINPIGQIWGPGFVQSDFGQMLYGPNNTATAIFQCQAGILIDGIGYATAIDRAQDPAIVHPRIATTAANIDLAVASGGFGGAAYGVNGGFIGVHQPTIAVPTTTLSQVTTTTPADSSPHVLESFTLPASPAVGTVTLFDVSWVARDTRVGSNDGAGKLSGAFANFSGTATQLGSSSATVFGSGSSLAFSVSGANVNLVGTGTGNIVNWTLKTVLTPNLT